MLLIDWWMEMEQRVQMDEACDGDVDDLIFRRLRPTLYISSIHPHAFASLQY